MAAKLADPRKAVIARDPKMLQVLDLVAKVADTDLNVLICGESGTGKDLIANTIHLLSRRAQGPLIKIDCANLPESLIESELFGYEKGAFTDASEGKPGRLELAQHGTIVLDDVSQLSLKVQAKLLRVTEEKRFQRLGGIKDIEIDARIIALANVHLSCAVENNLFRSDLFYRLSAITISLPPLRERRDDILPLAAHFLRKFASKHGKEVSRLSAEVRHMLSSYDYPGNVRELQNIIERAVILSSQEEITADLLPQNIRSVTFRRGEEFPTLAELERRYIQEVLEHTRWHKSRAAKILGIHRKTLLEKRKLYGIK